MTPAGTSNELDVQNGWEENTHRATEDQGRGSLRSRCTVNNVEFRYKLMGGDIGEIQLGSERELYKYINHYAVGKKISIVRRCTLYLHFRITVVRS